MTRRGAAVLNEIRAKLDQPALDRLGSRAKPTLYRGVMYRSMAEARHAASLDGMKMAGLVKSWSPQVSYPFVVNGFLVATYVADFLVETVGGYEVHEVKGWKRETWPIKAKLFQALYPDLPLIVFEGGRRTQGPQPRRVP